MFAAARGRARVAWRCFAVCTVAACVALGSAAARADGIGHTQAPVPGDPIRCFSPGDDTYCLMESGELRGLSGQRDLLRLGSHAGFRIGRVVCDVGPGQEAACLFTESRTEGSESNSWTRERLTLTTSDGRSFVLGEGIVDLGYGASVHGIYVRNGKLVRAWAMTDAQKRWHEYIAVGDAVVEVDLPTESFATALASATGERQQPSVEFFELGAALWAVGRSGTELVVGRVGPGMEWQRVAGASMYDVRTIAAADGYVYIFYHDSDANRTMVATSDDGESWRTIELDIEESGWQLDAAPAGYGVVATWYFMRNTYNKGLRMAFLRGGQLLQPAHTLVRDGDHNTGWCPHIGVAGDGTTWLTWIDDVLAHRRAWARLGSPLDLGEVRVPRFSDWRDRYKAWYLQGGGGGWYTLWYTNEFALDEKDTNAQKVGTVDRKLANTILLTGMFEARIWRIQLALGYAQSIVDAANEASGGKLSKFLGSVKFDKLFPGHDVQVRGTFGHYTGSATPAENGDADAVGPLRIDTPYWHAQALALNKWRIKYGLSYARYALPATVNVFSAAAGQTRYSYMGSYFRDVSFDDIRFLIGYSKLDYVARYENHYSGLMVDFDALIGASIMRFAVVQPMSQQSADTGLGWSFGAHVDLGWLWLQRFRGLAGFGLYLRPLYRAEFDGVFGGARPSDRESDAAKSRDTSAGASLLSVRHGPWFDLGLVW